MKPDACAGRVVLGRPAAAEPASTALDRAWQLAYRVVFRVARPCWRLMKRPHEGALVAVHVGSELLLVRSSYRSEWNFPGGGVHPGETPIQAAHRELAEELGLASELAGPADVSTGVWDGRPDRVHVYELRLARLPDLRLDNREIIDARLFAADELESLVVTGPVAAYLSKVGLLEPGMSSRAV